MVRYLNWWNNPDTDRWFTDFFNYMLNPFDENTKRMFLENVDIASVFGPPGNVLGLSPNRLKIFFIGENLKRLGYERYDNYELLSNKFDLVLGFHEQPNGLRNVKRFPLWLTYVPYYKDFNVVGAHSESCAQSYTRERKGIIVCSHDRTNIRRRCIDSCLNKNIKIDVAGKWNTPNTNKVVIGDRNIHKTQLLRAYLINVCPENSVDDGYTTEKIFQSIEAGCLPIYDGCRPVEDKVLNQSRIIYQNDLNDLSESDIIEKSKLPPYTKNAKFWIMKNYLDVWSKIWYSSHLHKVHFKYDPRLGGQSVQATSLGDVQNIHNYFIIPFRNRAAHIDRWTLEANKLYSTSSNFKFSVILVEQLDDKPFNKGVLLNVGYWKAMEMHHEMYNGLLNPRPNLIFNDVDVFCKDLKFLRPEEYVYHPYGDGHCLGCIFVCSPEAYLSFNGFSNKYNGWGREDADALYRTKIQSIPVKIDGYEQRKSNKSFVEFHHESNITKIKENYIEYDNLTKDHAKLYESGVNDEFIINKMLTSKTQREMMHDIEVTHIFV